MESPLRFQLAVVWLVVQVAICVAVTNVALVEFPLSGNESPINLSYLGAIMDKGEELLREKYGNIMNAKRVRLFGRNVTTCALLEQKAVFWLARYYYEQAERNQLMAFFGPGCSAPAVHVAAFAREWNAPMFVIRFYVNATDPANVEHYLDETKSIARVVLIIGHGSRIRPIMVAAYDNNMTNGDYVYFTIELYRSQRLFGNVSWNTQNKDGRDQDAREAYRSLFILSLRPDDAPEYRNFSSEIKRLSMEKYDYYYGDNEEVDPVAMSHYYAVAIYGQVLDETVAMGGNPKDGRAMSRLMWNRTFTVLGNDIVIGANGDRDANWLVNQMDPQTGLFQPVQGYVAREGMVRTYQNPAIWYKGRRLPPKEPHCGIADIKEPKRYQNVIVES